MRNFSKSLNPQNIVESVSDIRIRIRFPFESSFWISVSGCKLTILPDIQPANRIVIISAGLEYLAEMSRVARFFLQLMAKILIKNGQNGCLFLKLWPKSQNVLTMIISSKVSQIVRKAVYFLPKKNVVLPKKQVFP